MQNTLSNISVTLKSGQISRRNFIIYFKTKLIVAFLNILWNEGFISGYKIYSSNSNLLKIFLKYKNGNPVINSFKLVSKPSRKVYYSTHHLWKLDSKKNLIIFTTQKGLMTLNECRQANTGGKLLLIIR